MMLQANALRRLELILDEAVTNGDRNQASGPILLEAMKLSNQPQNLVDFYELLKKAEEGARKLKKLPKINRYLQTLEELHQVFVVHHVWNTSWNTFATHITASEKCIKSSSISKMADCFLDLPKSFSFKMFEMMVLCALRQRTLHNRVMLLL